MLLTTLRDIGRGIAPEVSGSEILCNTVDPYFELPSTGARTLVDH